MPNKNSTYQDEQTLRRVKLDNLKKAGINPYPNKATRTHTASYVIHDFKKLQKTKASVTMAGRIRLFRSHGNLSFIQIEDESGKIQIALTKKNLGRNYKLLTKNLDVGDFIQARGTLFTTHAGELTVEVKKLVVLAKSLSPLPDKWCGFQDVEERLRHRYLDILCNPEVREMIKRKNIFWQSIRQFLTTRDFLEVETPVLETTPGGADARPFVTRHNAFDMDVYLRVSCGELWQKKLLVGGLEKTFEIGRIFRNEGVSSEHLQDYTQMEFYWAYADYNDGMKLVARMYRTVIKQTFGKLKFKIGKFTVNFGKKWEIYDYNKIIKKYTKIDINNTNLAAIQKKLQELKVEYDAKGFNLNRGVDNLWKYCRKHLAGPGFLVNVPTFMEPLAKQNAAHPRFVERFQVIVAGSEMGKGYSELNDPIEQQKRFANQEKLRQQGDAEAQQTDLSFVEALEYGMPPACGFGVSERLFAFLCDKPVRECQIFPLMKPKE